MSARGALWLGAALWACTDRPARSPDVLVLTLDAVRADHVPGFGGEPTRAPELAAWIGGGRRFTNAYTSAPLTVPAHTSLFTGNYAHTHGARSQPAHTPTEIPLLAALARHGYTTAAFVAARILSPVHSGLEGFSHFDAPSGDEREAAQVIGAAVTWLEALPAERPAFLWVHLFEAHSPYMPHTPAWRSCPETVRALSLQRVQDLTKRGALPITSFKEPWWPTCLDDLYTGEISALDAALPQLRQALSRRGAAVWVILADHGECLGEDGILAQHGGTLNECALRIPLAVGGLPTVVPGDEARLTSLVDVAPTLAAALSLDLPGLEGFDLLRPAPQPRLLRFEAAGIAVKGLMEPLLGGRVGDEKIVLTPRTGAVEMWRVAQGRASLEPSLSVEGQALLDTLKQTAPPPRVREAGSAAAPLLRALGYVE